MRWPHLALAIGRGRERCHHAGDTERARARLALTPALRHHVDDFAAALAPIVGRVTATIGTCGALLQLHGVEGEIGAQVKRRRYLVFDGLGKEPSVRNVEGHRSRATVFAWCIDGASEEEVVLAAAIARLRTAQVPPERECHRLDGASA